MQNIINDLKFFLKNIFRDILISKCQQTLEVFTRNWTELECPESLHQITFFLVCVLVLQAEEQGCALLLLVSGGA